MRLKAPDSTCIPLCLEHHNVGREAWHPLGGREWFERLHGFDTDSEIRLLNREYEMTGAKLEKRKPKREKPAASAGKSKPMSERLRELREKRAK